MNPNQQQGVPGGGAGGGPPGGQSDYARQMMQAQQAALRQVQAQSQQHPQGGAQPGTAPAPAPQAGSSATPAGTGATAPGLDAKALQAIQTAIQSAVNDPIRMQTLLGSLVQSGRINPTQLAQIRAMLAHTNPNTQRPQAPVQSAMSMSQQQAQAMPPGMGLPLQQGGQVPNVAPAMQQQQQIQQAQVPPPAQAAPQQVAAPNPAARLAQIEAELLNEAKVNSEASMAADHVSQRINELKAAQAAVAPGTEPHKRIVDQLNEMQNKLAGVGTRFMEAKKYYDDLRAQQTALRSALGMASNALNAATNTVAGPSRPSSSTQSSQQPGAGADTAAPTAGGPPLGSMGIAPSNVELATGSADAKPSLDSMAPAQTAAAASAAAAAAGKASTAQQGDLASGQGNRPLIPMPQTLNRIEVSAPSVSGDAFPASRGPRPTLNQGLAAPNPVISTPSTLSRPDMLNAASTSANAAGTSSSAGDRSGTARASSPTVATASNWEELLGVAARESGKAAGKAAAAAQQQAGGGSSDDFEVVSVTPGPGVASSTFYTGGGSGRSTSGGGPRSSPAASQQPSGGSYVSASAGGYGGSSLGASQENRLLNKRKVQELVGEIDSGEQLEADVEDLLLEIADEFIESVTHFACKLAKHRRAEKLEVKDVQLHLERNWNIRVPFPGSMPIPPPRTRTTATTSKGGGGGGGAGANASNA